MDQQQFEKLLKAIIEKINQSRSSENEAILNKYNDIHLYPPALEAPTVYNNQMFGLFYLSNWRSSHTNTLKPQTRRNGNIIWGEIDNTHAAPTQANFFMHVELEYRMNTQEVNLRLHLETNRYVINSRLDTWENLGQDQEKRKRWRSAFESMRENVGQFLLNKNDRLKEIGWKHAMNGKTVMQVARSKEKLNINDIDLIFTQITKLLDFFEEEDIRIEMIRMLNGYWPQK